MSNHKRISKYAVSTIAAAAAVAAVAPVAASADTDKGFTDVKTGEEGYGAVGVHYDTIMNLAQQGIVEGDSDGKFHPWDNVVRGQIAKMMVEAQNLDIPEDTEEVLSVYDDVNTDNDYADEIAAVTKADVMEGMTDKEFDEYTDMTREQMASILVRAFDLDEMEADDVEVNLEHVSATHQDAVQTLANLEITKETTDFRAYDKITRAAFASLLDRTMKVAEQAEEDIEAPTINTPSENVITVGLNDELALPEVTATDNKDESVEVTTAFYDSDRNKVDNIDTSNAGTYTVTYTAEDKAGNKTVSAITVEVDKHLVDTASELTNAIEAAEASETITLLGDIELDNKLTIDHSVTINGNGHGVNDAVNIAADQVTVKDLTIDLPENETSAFNVAQGVTEATMEDNTINAEGNLAVYFNRDSSGSVLNNDITASRKGIGAQTTGNVTIKGNNITANDTAIELFVDNAATNPNNDGSNYTVSDNTYENNNTVVRP